MDDFSDDDLDALNANALQELENSAIRFTQAQKPPDRARPPFPPQSLPAPRVRRRPSPVNYLDDDLLDDAVVVVQAPQSRSAAPHMPAPAAAPARPAQLPSRTTPHQQQKQKAAWPTVSISTPASRLRSHPADAQARSYVGAEPKQVPAQIQAPPLPRPAPSTTSGYQPSQAHRQTGISSHELASLQAQIRDLQSKLSTKDGEIGIVRRRLDRVQQDHERELQLIKAQTAEQLAKQERAVEAARAAQESASTELEFTRRDLREEVVRAKRKDGPVTPKKNAIGKTWGVSDGFEDVEMAGSPSKGKRGKNAGPVASSVVEPSPKLLRTPTKSKRKRPAVDHPVMALETHSGDAEMLDDVGVGHAAVDGPFLPVTPNAPLDYLRVILNHSAARGGPLTFENLSRVELPSRPHESLASILLRKLSTAGDPGDPIQLPLQFCLEVIRLWDSCEKDNCLAPIADLVSLVSFTLQLQTVALAPHIAPSLLPVAMGVCYAVAMARFNNTAPSNPTSDVSVQGRESTDTHEILSLLYLTALGCATSKPVGGSIESPAVDFWSSVHIRFALVFLSRKQPLDDFVAMLRLLCTSVFPDSIGPIDPDASPEVTAKLLIDRISGHLTETSPWDVDEIKLREVQLTAVQTLLAFASSPFGLAQLVQHDWVIPRLVTLLSYCIERLYDGNMEYSAVGEDDDASDGLQRLVARTMFLLHMIITKPLSSSDAAAAVDVSAKLARTTGGSQRYLLSLSRLNFSDELVSEDTAELAHELLELAVTSEAGEELGEFFSG
ncbi:hypothetical protein F4802DRAFT_508540 [Xylaria palmicola]|nr:hypothetical protein F4802DRAFT_508540 [Xylaria palmicola]